MMGWIIGSSLKFRRLVVALAAGLLVFGIVQLNDARTDALPEFQRPTVEVQTEALGLSAEEVEQLITVPLEQDLLVGIAFLDEIESVSLPGLSSVVMTFEPGTELLDARQVVAERLTQAVAAAGLPQVANPPQMINPLSSTGRVAMVKLTSDVITPMEMSVLSHWVIVPRLLGVEGVANVSIWGFRDRQLQVLVDPERLNEADVSLAQVIATAGNALEVSPLSFLEAVSPGTGGFIDILNERLHIFHQQAIETPAELAQVPVEGPRGGIAAAEAGAVLTLGDVADVVEDHHPLIGDALCTDGDCLLLVIEKFPASDTPQVAAGIDEALGELAPGLPGVSFDTSIYRPAEFIESSFGSIGWAAVIGAVLLILIIGAFTYDWRSALVSATAIVMSLGAAWLVLYFTETTINTMTIAGLAMALVALIDDAVIDVDHIARRLDQRQGDGTPAWQLIIAGAMEMRSAILFATLIVGAAVMPAFFMEGEGGAFLPAIATAYLLAIVASLLVAITVTPALGMMLLGSSTRPRPEAPVARWLRARYQAMAPRIVGVPRTAVLFFGGAVIVGLVAAPFLTGSLRPVLKERDVVVQLEAPAGTSLPRMDEITSQAVERLRAIPGIDDVGAHVGRAIQSDQIVNVNAAEVWLGIANSADYDATMDAIEAVARDLPEVSTDVLTYSEQRVTEVLGRTSDEVVVRVYGQDQQILESKAEEVRAAILGIDGLNGADVVLPAEEPTIEVQPDIERAQAVGLAPGDVRRAATTLLSGLVVGNLFEEQKVFDVVVWGEPGIRQTEADVADLRIDTPEGGLVRLGDIADVRVVPNPAVIRHESVESFVDVVTTVGDRDPADVAADIETTIAGIDFPLEHHASVVGGFAEEAAARTRLITIAATAAIGIFLLLQAAFGSWRLAIVAFVALPMSLAGGAVAALIAGGEVGLGSVAGFVAVLGLAARGTIVSIRRYQQLQREGEPLGIDLVTRVTSERLVPILTVALGSIAFLIPFVVRSGAGGFELVGPMATVVLGGIVTTALLQLVVIPAAYLRFAPEEVSEESTEDLLVRIPDIEPVSR